MSTVVRRSSERINGGNQIWCKYVAEVGQYQIVAQYQYQYFLKFHFQYQDQDQYQDQYFFQIAISISRSIFSKI